MIGVKKPGNAFHGPFTAAGIGWQMGIKGFAPQGDGAASIVEKVVLILVFLVVYAFYIALSVGQNQFKKFLRKRVRGMRHHGNLPC